MSWRLRVRHQTVYEYDGTIHASYNEARISPLDAPSQFTLEHRVDVAPAASLLRYRDYWGTRVHVFDLHQPHDRLEVTGHSLVETAARTAVPDTGVTWDALRAPGLVDRLCEYLAPTTFTAWDQELTAQAAELVDPGSPAASVEAIVDWIRANLTYTPGATNVSTTAAEVVHHRAGVCQDFVHLGLALLRASGIPARYASGYLFPVDEAEIGASVEGQSHAWLEAWVGDWCPMDPTTAMRVAERHVLVARGRDYADVPPLKGVYNGSPARSLEVSVGLTRVA